MSNSHACQGQRTSSPRRAYSYSPGPDALIAPSTCPSHSGPPWCGQRLRSAWNSPSRLNTAIERPATSTILRPPGGISSARATMCLAIGGVQPVQRVGVVAQDAPAPLVAERARDRALGRVEVPVRIVGREHDPVVHVDVVEED